MLFVSGSFLYNIESHWDTLQWIHNSIFNKMYIYLRFLSSWTYSIHLTQLGFISQSVWQIFYINIYNGIDIDLLYFCTIISTFLYWIYIQSPPHFEHKSVWFKLARPSCRYLYCQDYEKHWLRAARGLRPHLFLKTYFVFGKSIFSEWFLTEIFSVDFFLRKIILAKIFWTKIFLAKLFLRKYFWSCSRLCV